MNLTLPQELGKAPSRNNLRLHVLWSAWQATIESWVGEESMTSTLERNALLKFEPRIQAFSQDQHIFFGAQS